MERWVEAVLSPTDQAKCDLLGIRVMRYQGYSEKYAPYLKYSVRKRLPPSVTGTGIVNLCTERADATKEVAVFNTSNEAIKGATNKKYFFPGVT